jgi:hypothetical protein
LMLKLYSIPEERSCQKVASRTNSSPIDATPMNSARTWDRIGRGDIVP